MKSIAIKYIVFFFWVFIMCGCNSKNLNAPMLNEQDIIGKTKYDIWKIINSIETKNKTYIVALGNHQYYSTFIDSKPVPDQLRSATSWRWHGPFHRYTFNFNKQDVVTSMVIREPQ